MPGVSFRVTADAINGQVQALMLDGDWVQAQRMLVDAVEGLSVEQAYGIMRGETAFVNVDGHGQPDPRGDCLQFAEVAGAPPPDDLRGYAEEIRAKWAGVLKVDGVHYQPYAYVTSMGIHDRTDPTRRLPATLAKAARRNLSGTEWVESAATIMAQDIRPAHYANDQDDDLVLDARIPDGLPVTDAVPDVRRVRMLPAPFLFRRVPAPPPWIMPARTITESIAANLAAGNPIHETGHLTEYGPATPSPDEGDGHETQGVAARSAEDVAVEAAQVAAEAAGAERRHAATLDAIDRDIAAARERVMGQLGVPGRDGWLDLAYGDVALRIPEAPFTQWTLARCGGSAFAPPWQACSRPGLKLNMEYDNDDPLHTDWMLGAGLDVRTLDWYGDGGKALREAAYDLMGEIQSRVLGKGCTVLADGGPRTGNVYVARRGRVDDPSPGDVVVLPDASADWLDTVVAACGHGGGTVVVAQGGAVAHLVVVTGAAGATIVRDPDAMSRFEDGMTVAVDPARRVVAIVARPHAIDMEELEGPSFRP